MHLTSKKTLQHSTHSVLFKCPKRFSSLGSSLGIAAVSWPFHVRTKKGTILSRNESGVRTQVRIRVVIRTASFAFIVHATRDRALLAQSHRRFRHFKFTLPFRSLGFRFPDAPIPECGESVQMEGAVANDTTSKYMKCLSYFTIWPGP